MYEGEDYLTIVKRKLIKIREDFKVQQRTQIVDRIDSSNYQSQLQDLYRKYPVTGGGEDVYMLISMYIINNNTDEIDDDHNDNDNDNDDDNEEEEDDYNDDEEEEDNDSNDNNKDDNADDNADKENI